MTSTDHKQEPRGFKREEGMPKNGLGNDLSYRIKGLEQAKTYEGMSRADIAALDRVINKLKDQLEARNANKPEEKENPNM